MAHDQDDLFSGVEEGEWVYSDDDRTDPQTQEEVQTSRATIRLAGPSSSPDNRAVERAHRDALGDALRIRYEQVETARIAVGLDTANTPEAEAK